MKTTDTPQFKAFKAAIDKMVDDFWKHEAERIDIVIKEWEKWRAKNQTEL